MEDSSDSDSDSDGGFVEDAQVRQAEKVISSRRYLFRKETQQFPVWNEEEKLSS